MRWGVGRGVQEVEAARQGSWSPWVCCSLLLLLEELRHLLQEVLCCLPARHTGSGEQWVCCCMASGRAVPAAVLGVGLLQVFV